VSEKTNVNKEDSDLEARVKNIERDLTLAKTVGGILGGLFLGWLGITSFYQIPKAVNDSILGLAAKDAAAARDRAVAAAQEAEAAARGAVKNARVVEGIAGLAPQRVVSTGVLLLSTRKHATNPTLEPYITTEETSVPIKFESSLPPKATIRTVWFNVARGNEHLQHIVVLEPVISADRRNVSLNVKADRMPDPNRTPDPDRPRDPPAYDIYINVFCTYVD
jgi:hypothetical protein